MKVNKERIEQAGITAIVTLIVAMVGATMFNIYAALYSGIAAGLSVTVGKEYGDSLVIENSWHWIDAIPGFIGVIVGILTFTALHQII